MFVESWFKTQKDLRTLFTMDDLRYVYPSDNRKFPKNTIYCFLRPYNDKIAWFSIFLVPLVVYSWLNPQNKRKNGFAMDVLWYLHHSDNRKFPKNAFFWSCKAKLQKFSYHENYISLSWPTFQNDRMVRLSISVY